MRETGGRERRSQERDERGMRCVCVCVLCVCVCLWGGGGICVMYIPDWGGVCFCACVSVMVSVCVCWGVEGGGDGG